MNIRMKLAVVAALTAALPAFAQIKINDNISVYEMDCRLLSVQRP